MTGALHPALRPTPFILKELAESIPHTASLRTTVMMDSGGIVRDGDTDTDGDVCCCHFVKIDSGFVLFLRACLVACRFEADLGQAVSTI